MTTDNDKKFLTATNMSQAHDDECTDQCGNPCSGLSNQTTSEAGEGGHKYSPQPRSFAQPLKSILRRPSVRFAADVIGGDDTSHILISAPQPTYLQPDESGSTLPGKPVPLFLRPRAPPSPPPQEFGQAGPRPPTLFKKKIESNKDLNKVAVDLYNNFLQELSQFVSLQEEVVRKRLEVRSKRIHLARLRDCVSQCDIKLFDYLREHIVNKAASDETNFAKLYDEAHIARDEVGPAEAEYDLSEVELGAEESKLSEKYSDLVTKFDHFFNLEINSTAEEEPVEIQYESSDASDEAADMDLLWGAVIGEQIDIGAMPFTRRDGKLAGPTKLRTTSSPREENPGNRLSEEANIAKKSRSNLSGDERAIVDIGADLMGIAGTEGNSMHHSQELIPEYTGMSSEDSLKGLDTDSLFGTYDHPASFPDDIPVAANLVHDSTLFLPGEDQITRSILHDYLTYFDSTPIRVNQWLLHQLRISLREIYALRAFFEDNTIDLDSWAQLVLEEWFNDLIGYDVPYHQGSLEDSSEVSDASPQHKEESLVLSPQVKAIYHHRKHSSLVSNMAHATISDTNDKTQPFAESAEETPFLVIEEQSFRISDLL